MDEFIDGSEDLIVSDDIIDGVRKIVIENFLPTSNGKENVRLSHIFKYLPSGMVVKDETGMGATTLEIKAPRPSIIVEPLKFTASSKAVEHGAIYFGSSTAKEPRPTPNVFREKLKNRLENQRKIIVVADSLPIVRDLLKDEFHAYFLMIDEVDSFQLDSTFRDSMAKCLDIYKEHPPQLRALVTATPLEFSDPDLKKENKVHIRYRTSNVRNIKLEHTNSKDGAIEMRAIEIIKDIRTKHPDEKIMIAYNSVDGCVSIAKHLVLFESVATEDIKILCSVAADSKRKAADFFHELDANVLPGKINLVTSAYFTGFDLHDSYHLIIISDSRNRIQLLSDKRIKQISGRCRKKLESETVVYTTSPYTVNFPTEEEMLKAAAIEKSALNCINLNYEDAPLLKQKMSDIREYIIRRAADHGTQFLRTNIYGQPVENYLSIDASIEASDVRKYLYEEKEQLYQILIGQGHNVILNSQATKANVSVKQIESVEDAQQVEEVINRIINAIPAELNDLQNDHSLSRMEKGIIEAYLDHSPYLEQSSVVEILKSYSSKNTRKFENMKRAALFYSSSDSENFKSRVLAHFTIGNSYSREEIAAKWNRIYAETSSFMGGQSFTITFFVQQINLYFRTTKVRTGPKGMPLDIKITGTNPFGFKLIKHRPDPIDPIQYKEK